MPRKYVQCQTMGHDGCYKEATWTATEIWTKTVHFVYGKRYEENGPKRKRT